MKDITPQTLIYDLLNDYPELEDKLIETAPIFIKLKNPVLRRTIAKVTTLKQASVVGNVPLGDLINKLRTEAGLNILNNVEGERRDAAGILPAWVNDNAGLITYDAREDLEKGIHPLAKVMQDVTHLKNKEVYKLVTSFVPAPLIDKVKQKGFETFTNDMGTVVETFVRAAVTL